MAHDDASLGIPIDQAKPPEWVAEHFTKEQLRGLRPVLLWQLLIYRTAKARIITPPQVSIAQRLYVFTHTMQKAERKAAWPSVRGLAADLGMGSTNTVEAGLSGLQKRGLIVTEPRPNNGKAYLPAWPKEDCLAACDGPERCGERTKKGRVCTRRAGWGTPFDKGPCKRHLDRPGASSNETPGVSSHEAPPSGVSSHEAVPHEMRHSTSSDETEYIRSSSPESHHSSPESDQSRIPGVPSVVAEVESTPPEHVESSTKINHQNESDRRAAQLAELERLMADGTAEP